MRETEGFKEWAVHMSQRKTNIWEMVSFGCLLKVGPTRFADGLDRGNKAKTKDDATVLGLSN